MRYTKNNTPTRAQNDAKFDALLAKVRQQNACERRKHRALFVSAILFCVSMVVLSQLEHILEFLEWLGAR